MRKLISPTVLALVFILSYSATACDKERYDDCDIVVAYFDENSPDTYNFVLYEYEGNNYLVRSPNLIFVETIVMNCNGEQVEFEDAPFDSLTELFEEGRRIKAY
ncbi:hypothetical protein CEQ90_10830 [Lewinellaceae bacterium SD302]|nr:hypothetical protein CEQ90_10830 [Lewinellaceae bacterium SD302]